MTVFTLGRMLGLLLAFFPAKARAGAGVDFDFMEFLNKIPRGDEVFQEMRCSEEEKETMACNLTPFSGIFVCRSFFSLFGDESKHHVCVRNFADGVALGFDNDSCGCCDGICPEECVCGCGKKDENGVHDSVEIAAAIILDFASPKFCAPRGVADHLTWWGGRFICDNSCQDNGDGDGDGDGDGEGELLTLSPGPTLAPVDDDVGDDD